MTEEQKKPAKRSDVRVTKQFMARHRGANVEKAKA
jgi:hypothetical protein